ncbi:uncharacterized mitochondrial protein AtMg00820-like [Nicotiana tomentosiformis]|uniref:uncharacterized mitochondrial protein AtMg00820-like n=1 Tax=Nicotiana tomentosiformis TaxID=4098 RepID=UPI00388C42FE
MENGKADMIRPVKESNGYGAIVSPNDVEEPGSSITTTKAEKKVVDVVQGTTDVELRRIQTRSKSRNSLSFSAFLSQIEPKHIKEALKNVDWITTMQDELHQFERNNVWHLVTRPADRTVIGTMWVFRNKLDEFGNTTKNKARLVVQGYNQEEGIDYDKTFASIARMEAIRFLIAFASYMEFKLFQTDV